MIAGIVASGIFYTSGSALFAADSGDSVSASDQKARIEAFQALKYLVVSKVSAAEMPAAIDSMHLNADEQSKLRADLVRNAAASSQRGADTRLPAAKEAGEHAGAATAHAAAKTDPTALEQAKLPLAAPAAQAAQPVLAWVRLWDSDVEDGDVVRIDSDGYSRTVTLTKRGITFAVPVSANGQIRITGVRDGDGGGITVGLGSGSAQAILPIMSVGQVLSLNVRTN
ncbi:hypothetical protein [Trinickia dinghuensis]|uniref:Uncharacterized protein n=1 Tax=Trinickia dinghuensis TaxID=2291023 RepID=A0A3D8JSK1_9BURK|nr:hypothetical protein [Trinickia dinghuensis]RDU96109.1 hypothetical protein DWV00_26080 [Trinickia dinghuensis]